ncbi:MAG: NAD(P)-dependent oxidoreductase [Lachnospira eligens]
MAARKISRLKGFGVKIKVVAPSIVSDIEAMAQACDNISVERRIFTPQDIENADFVIAAAGEEADKEAARLCKEKAIRKCCG